MDALPTCASGLDRTPRASASAARHGHARTARAVVLGALACVLACAQDAAVAGFIDERPQPPVQQGQQGQQGHGQGASQGPGAGQGADAPAAPAAAPSAPAGIPEAGTRVGVVQGGFAHPGWRLAAPGGQAPQRLTSALVRLLPAEHPPVVIDGEAAVLAQEVQWPDDGMTRREVLDHIASRYGINMTLGERSLRASRADFVTGPVSYTVRMEDRNVRTLLKRWAAQAGYTFGDTHWTLQRDLPIVAAAHMGSDFKQAVRELLRATELSAFPARACFYSNQVMRVVPRGQVCDRLN